MGRQVLLYAEKMAKEVNSICSRIHGEMNISSQIKRSSTSTYANIREAHYAQSTDDMISKLEIALKECYETEGWLKLLHTTGYLSKEEYLFIRNMCGRIRRMLIASCRTLKQQL